MAHGRGQQDDVVALAGERHLAVRDVAVGERHVDPDAVLALRQRLRDAAARAEPPALGPVGRPVRHDVRVARVGVQVLPQRGEVDRRVHRDAVAEKMERGIGDVDDAGSVRPLDPGLADVPFARQRPVEDLRPRRELHRPQRDVLADPRERRPHAVPGEAARERVELLHQPVELAADDVGIGNGGPVDRHRRAGRPGGASP